MEKIYTHVMENNYYSRKLNGKQPVIAQCKTINANNVMENNQYSRNEKQY